MFNTGQIYSLKHQGQKLTEIYASTHWHWTHKMMVRMQSMPQAKSVLHYDSLVVRPVIRVPYPGVPPRQTQYLLGWYRRWRCRSQSPSSAE
jgi:hypothetical protein